MTVGAEPSVGIRRTWVAVKHPTAAAVTEVHVSPRAPRGVERPHGVPGGEGHVVDRRPGDGGDAVGGRRRRRTAAAPLKPGSVARTIGRASGAETVVVSSRRGAAPAPTQAPPPGTAVCPGGAGTAGRRSASPAAAGVDVDPVRLHEVEEVDQRRPGDGTARQARADAADRRQAPTAHRDGAEAVDEAALPALPGLVFGRDHDPGGVGTDDVEPGGKCARAGGQRGSAAPGCRSHEADLRPRAGPAAGSSTATARERTVRTAAARRRAVM